MTTADEGLKNQRTAEYLFLALLLSIGTPVCLIWGSNQGEKMAARAYPVEKKEAIVAASFEIFMPSTANIEKGQSLFQANCISCHGEKADGNGPAATALTPPPRNFLDPKARWTRSRNPKDIFQVITEGSPGTGMVPFGSSLSQANRWALVHYLGSLPGAQGQFAPIDETLARKMSEETP